MRWMTAALRSDLGSKAHPLASGTSHYLSNVLLKQVEIKVSKGHRMIAEYLLVVDIVMLAYRFGRTGRFRYRTHSTVSFRLLIVHGRSTLTRRSHIRCQCTQLAVPHPGSRCTVPSAFVSIEWRSKSMG